MAKVNKCAHLLAYITGLVNQELLLQNEYLAAENRILRSHLPPRLRLSDPERETLAAIGTGLGRRALGEVATPDTILGWYRKLIAEKFDGFGLKGSIFAGKVTGSSIRRVLPLHPRAECH